MEAQEPQKPRAEVDGLAEERIDHPVAAGASSTSQLKTSRVKGSQSGSSRSLSKSTVDEDVPDFGCCLAWSFSGDLPALAQESDLLLFHKHLHQCVDLFQAKILMEEAASGLVLGCPVESKHFSASDTALRMGQLLCRWATSKGLGLRVGVHVGGIKRLTLLTAARKVFYGEACATAAQLAASSNDWQVHMSTAAKSKLNAFRLVQMTISPWKSSYLLDPTTVVGNFFSPQSKDDPQRSGIANRFLGLHSYTPDVDPGSVVTPDMLEHEFEDLLRSHEVNVNLFGKGAACSLADFYASVVRERKCDLIMLNGALERIVNLARISLRVRDSENKLRELRVVSDPATGRNMPLAMTLALAEQGQWQRGMEKCFEQLHVSMEVQRSCFSVDMESYRFSEERAQSERIPGLMTTYRCHNITIDIKDKSHPDLSCIGLPDVEGFTSDTGTELEQSWLWALVGHNVEEDELMSLLQAHGIVDLEPQAFADLHDEVYLRQLSSLAVQGGELVRKIHIVKVWLHASILNVDHILVMRAKWQKGRYNQSDQDRPIAMRMREDQELEDAVVEALSTRLGLGVEFQARYLNVDKNSHQLSEETAYSRSYPGLKSLYFVNEVSAYVLDSTAFQGRIGLPKGLEFAFTRRGLRKRDRLPDEEIITYFHWMTKEELRNLHTRLLGKTVSICDGDDLDDPEDPTLSRPDLRVGRTLSASDYLVAGRVPLAAPLELKTIPAGTAVPVLAGLMRGRKTNWKRAKSAAFRIRDPNYTCKSFHDDVVEAFPELRLYCYQGDRVETTASSLTLTSGRSADDEYQRTIGALFAVFWTMRMDIDGRESFCFGLDDEWLPRSPNARGIDPDERERRKVFLEKADWGTLRRLLVDAGLLIPGSNGRPDEHNEERTLAMLVLMSIHDIMKIGLLLPTVDKKVKTFSGYKAGETISDHDLALSYVLMHHPELLPSFAGLDKPQQESIKFTQCKLEYNMGWLVQAEAPPGALFSTFRSIITTGKARNCDIAFYFVHWFVDLAGAEPRPLDGCEKFVLRFPQKVLARFMESFGVVQTLSKDKSETAVLEDYLIESWQRQKPSLGPVPEGEGSIAKMRLVLMAQGDSASVLTNFEALHAEDRMVLCEEMAVTGCKSQQYRCDSSASGLGGPSLLIYYAPALMQKVGAVDSSKALQILAEVYRQARELWPFDSKEADASVTVRIDSLKDMDVARIFEPEAGDFWILSKTSSKDAMVTSRPVRDLQIMNWEDNRILTFSKRKTGKARTGARFHMLFSRSYRGQVTRSSSGVGHSFSTRLLAGLSSSPKR